MMRLFMKSETQVSGMRQWRLYTRPVHLCDSFTSNVIAVTAADNAAAATCKQLRKLLASKQLLHDASPAHLHVI